MPPQNIANERNLILSTEIPELQTKPSDIVPPDDREDITTIDEQELASSLLTAFENDIRDKEEFGWAEKRKYDVESYYGLKNEALANWPYKGASSYRAALIPTLVDTAAANVKASIWDDSGNSVKVSPQGTEDERTAPLLESYLNWKVNNEIDIDSAVDSCIFRSFHNGTSFLKVMRNFKNNILVRSFDSENLYLPVDARGMQIEETDRVTQIIPLTYNDIQIRKKVYRNIENIHPGIGLGGYASSNDMIIAAKDRATGTSLEQRYARETYFIAETYLTYYPKNSIRAKELIVWWSPNGLIIHRIRENKDGFRPYADFHSYPNHGRFWSMSLCEKVRAEQEKIEYADKQNTDGLDKSNSPAMFVENTDEFDPNIEQRKPNGVYKIGRNNRVFWENQPPVERGFERQLDYYWQIAERKTGIIDITQGRSSQVGRTLGEVEIRTTRADVRFSSVLDRFNGGWSKTINLIYEYANRYESREKKLKVLGYNDFRTLNEIFPVKDGEGEFVGSGLGLKGSYDFSFSGKSVIDREQEKQNTILFYEGMMVNPLVATNPASIWKISKEYAEALGKKNFSALVPKPKEVNIYGVEEFIQRVMSGQYDIQIRPGIDTDDYFFEIELFMRTESFQALEPQAQKALLDARRRAYMMGVAERQALADANMVMQSLQDQSALGQVQGGGNEGQFKPQPEEGGLQVQ